MDGLDGEQQFSLSWNNFHGNVSRELSTLLGSGALADVTLAVGGELLQAHRLVLAICSPYFKRMFQANPHHHPIVVLRDVTHKAMLDLLQFMYHGEVSVKREDLTGFIATAELLQIKGLTNKETEDEDKEQELPKQATPEPGSISAPQQRLSNAADSICTDDHISYTVEMKRKILNEKIQRLNQLKRTSEQFLQSNYNYHTERPEKRRRSREKTLTNNHNENARYEKLYDDVPTDMSNYSDSHKSNASQDYDDASKTDVSYDVSVLDLKTECDDSDIVVTDPAIHDSAKSFDCVSEHTAAKDTLHHSQDGILCRTSGNEHQLPVRYKYIYSRKGHKQLVHMNFVYTKHSTTHGKTSWRCVQYFSLNRCPATVETIEHMLFAINHQHNHEDCSDKIAKNNVYESADGRQ